MYAGDETGLYLDGSGWEPEEGYVVTERDWYKEGINHTEFTFGKPYVDANTGEVVVSATSLIDRSDRKNMVASMDVFLSVAEDIISGINVMDTESGYGFLVDASESLIMLHKDSSWNGTQISTSDSDPLMAQIAGLIEEADGSVHLIQDDGLDNFVTLTPIENTSWVLVISVSRQEIFSELYRMIYFYIAVAAVCIIIVSCIMVKVIGSVIKPIKQLTDNLEQISEGDFSVEIEYHGNDEIASMSRALKSYIENMRVLINDINAVSRTLDINAVDGKKSAQLLSTTSKEQQKSMQNMQTAVDVLVRSISDLANDAASLAEIVDTTNDEGKSVDQRMVETVGLTKEGHKDISEVQNVMKTMVSNMEELSGVVEMVGKSTDEINEIIKMIEDIASQTNLLSLNASIEAARAGETGKGFAVVAEEIGKLAVDSSQSTQQISNIINSINGQIETMVRKTRENVIAIEDNAGAIDKACETFEHIMDDINLTSDDLKKIIDRIKTVDEVAINIANISKEQSSRADEVLNTIEFIAGNSSQIAEESKGMEENSEIVTDSSETLVKHMNFFHI